MVRCVYKKFTIRKGLEFKGHDFEQVLLKVGKLALHTLLTGDPLLQRSEVISEVGEHAFDYGLLIGHEDFRLIRNEIADIFITFPHRSLQEFLGAFFLLSLAGGEPLERYLGTDRENPLFMINPLFLKFCLWLLSDSQKYFTIKNRKRVCLKLQRFIFRQIPHCKYKRLNLPHMLKQYPALKVDDACVRNDEVGLKFFKEMLKPFHCVLSFITEYKKTLDWIFAAIPSVLNSVKFCYTHSGLYVANLDKNSVPFLCLGSRSYAA